MPLAPPLNFQRWIEEHRHLPVSYTHLDVYKRQLLDCADDAAWLARLDAASS